jgi:hypothetical protein
MSNVFDDEDSANDYKPDVCIAETFFKIDDMSIYVRTFNRDSSSCLGKRYTHTNVWSMPNWPSRKLGKILDDGFCSNHENNFAVHLEACQHWATHKKTKREWELENERA